MQKAVFEAAAGPQILFIEADKTDIKIRQPPFHHSLAATCRLSRDAYTKNKELFRSSCGGNYWVNSRLDIFYFHDDHMPPSHRREPAEAYDRRPMIRNIAVDFESMGKYPRGPALICLWGLFPSMRELHLFVPSGPPQTPTPPWPMFNLVLRDLPDKQIIASPGGGMELWWVVKYHLNKWAAEILSGFKKDGWNRFHPEINGYLAEKLFWHDGTVDDGTADDDI
ncbi:hypothetical protein B0H63DRAFT_14196 [Podospora didyma]|uniref:Uncharacterized protein n=1 Tax=Podospora didyma TaxID=330526 RepID=A0AAE0P4G8_9PEZI|nr:hypothetical protein B0H63DRAFT_14196 [Podospora didyma]